MLVHFFLRCCDFVVDNVCLFLDSFLEFCSKNLRLFALTV